VKYPFNLVVLLLLMMMMIWSCRQIVRQDRRKLPLQQPNFIARTETMLLAVTT